MALSSSADLDALAGNVLEPCAQRLVNSMETSMVQVVNRLQASKQQFLDEQRRRHLSIAKKHSRERVALALKIFEFGE